jgi:hypothetical protein
MSKKSKTVVMANAKLLVSEPDGLSATATSALLSLAQEREQWDNNAYKTSNLQLYALLGKAMNLFDSLYVKAKKAERIVLRDFFEKTLSADGIRIQANTNILTLFVRYIFRADRNRTNTYVQVLKIAAKEKVTAERLPGWISNAGGVEEVKRSGSENPKVHLNKADFNKEVSEIRAEVEKNAVTPLATVALNGVSGSYALLLVKPFSEEVRVVGSLSNLSETQIEGMFKSMAKERIKKKSSKPQISPEDQDILSMFSHESDFDQVEVTA